MSTYRVIGIEASPYSVKVRAVLRYRRLPYTWLSRMPQYFEPTQDVRPLIMPVVQYPDGGYHVDSTAVILDLEARHPGTRSVVPEDPGAALVSTLIEDLADEWLTKSLFHYRFSDDADALYGARWVMEDAHPGLTDAGLAEHTRAFIERQRERMPLVGCIPANAALLAAGYCQVLDAVESMAASGRYLFGTRPSLADFGLYGQLKTLATDPTPMALMRARAPRTEHWVRRLDDASGVDGEWDDATTGVTPAVRSLLAIAADVYVPYLLANAGALGAGSPSVAVDLDGSRYTQPPFRYHAKCLAALQAQVRALDAASLARLHEVPEARRCIDLLTGR